MRVSDISPPSAPALSRPDLSNPAISAVIAASIAINVLVLAVPLYINRIYTSVLPQKAGDSLLVITALLVAVLLMDLLLKLARAWVLTLLAASEEHRLRLSGIRALLAAPLQASQAGAVHERLTQLRDVGQLKAVFEQQWLVRRVDVPFTLVYLLVLGLIGGWLVLVPIALTPLFVQQASRARHKLTLAIRHRDQAQAIRDGISFACLQSAPTIKAFNLEGFLVRRQEPSEEAFAQAVFEQESATARLQNLSQLYAQASQLLIVTIGAWLVINQSLSTGALAACTLLSAQVTMPIGKLFTAQAQQATQDLAEDHLNALRQLPAEPALLRGEPVPAEGEVRVGPLLFTPGTRTLLTGGLPHQSAAWLESITALRAAAPGDVQLDGRTTQTMELSQLRQRLRLVTVGTPLLHGTILDHLTQFRVDQLGDRAVALCQQHGVSAQILQLPRGFDTLAGENADFPLPAGLVFRLQIIQALMEAPLLLMVDASETLLSETQLRWLLGLQLEPALLLALPSPPRTPLPEATRLVTWNEQFLQEVPA